MDVQARSDVVNPPAAVRPERERRIDLAILAAAGAGGLAVALGMGAVSPAGALVIGSSLLATFALLLVRSITSAAARAEEASADLERLERHSVLLRALPQPVMLLDANDRVELANPACAQMFGAVTEGDHFSSIIRAPTALDTLREARHAGEAREAEFSVSSPENRTALCYVAPLEPGRGGPAGEMMVMVRDRTDQKRLERMRTDFIANAGHELRTPLASLLGFIETLRGHARDDPAARERFLKIMQGQTERMLRLVQDLVSLSALELNERRVPHDVVDLCEVAQVVREIMAPVAAAANGTVVPGHADCTAPVMGDRDQLIQVLQNLVDNALKYGGRNGDGPATVHVSVGRGAQLAFPNADKSGDSPERIAVRVGCKPDDLLYVRVRDEGIGIDRTDLPRLTERFYRIDVERSRSKGGTGLGLAIVKHIVGRHRGGILVESSPGEGAAFTCYFPPKDRLSSEAVQVSGTL